MALLETSQTVTRTVVDATGDCATISCAQNQAPTVCPRAAWFSFPVTKSAPATQPALSSSQATAQVLPKLSFRLFVSARHDRYRQVFSIRNECLHVHATTWHVSDIAELIEILSAI